jgi:hypothetical protein
MSGNNIETRMVVVEDRLMRIADTQADHTERLTQIEAKLDAVEAMLGAIAATLASISARLP